MKVTEPDWSADKYRIKPQPRERWIVVWKSGQEAVYGDPETISRVRDTSSLNIKEIFRVEEKEGDESLDFLLLSRRRHGNHWRFFQKGEG